jgi:Chromo (CHRromatin Organisation MOdifier) domain
VERANKEINRHLRALCFDLSSTSDLHLMIPFVQRIMNSTANAITHIKPAQIMFGNLVNLDEGILTSPSPASDDTDLPATVQAMIQMQETLISRSNTLRQAADKRRLAEHSLPPSDFAPGTLVLVQYAQQPPTRLHTHWFGPMRVISNDKSAYTLLDLVTKKERQIHVKRIKEFIFSTTADPLDIARRDYLEFFVEEILSHRGNVKKVSTLQFFVKWLGYPSTDNSWESYNNLRLVAPLHDYLRSRQLQKLIPASVSKPSSS